MRVMVILKTPAGGVITVGGIKADHWHRNGDMYLFTKGKSLSGGLVVAEARADEVLAIAIDDSVELADAGEVPEYSAADLVAAMVEWYFEAWGGPHADALGGSVAMEPIAYAATVVHSIPTIPEAQRWVVDRLAELHQKQN